MNENAQKWVEALRSNEYAQGKRYLHSKIEDEDRFCCLGVACKLYLEENSDIKAEPETRPNLVRYGGKLTTLPIEVQKWLGLSESMGWFTLSEDSNDGAALSWMNDTGHSFERIADVIEYEPEGLFVAED